MINPNRRRPIIRRPPFQQCDDGHRSVDPAAVQGLLLHGVQKGQLPPDGKGPTGGAQGFEGDGFRGEALTVPAAGGGQIGAGLLLAAGLHFPLAAARAVGVMTVALRSSGRTAFGCGTTATSTPWSSSSCLPPCRP
ncbi:DoxX family membrane protein [Streptomyces sp. b94]|uniref:DoxX family membrane protein n=1 Tax=Streptomyces sp. b94 TaxID=1827634 RepID=UPI001FFD4C1D|nr:DoxX family membrane protein [Streptomyces sp. b94]